MASSYISLSKHELQKSKPSGVARQLVPFLVLPGKGTKRSRPQLAAASRFPALLKRSGGCGTRATRSDSPRRLPLTVFRYSAGTGEGKLNFKTKTIKAYGGLSPAICFNYKGKRSNEFKKANLVELT
jgi:hypothetical protein